MSVTLNKYDSKDKRRNLIPLDDLWPSKVHPKEIDSEGIFVLGNAEILSEPCISIIGARRGTPYGLAVARMAGRIAARNGIVVVSGGAMGVDAAALRAALDEGGKTIVVPGHGANFIYPKSSSDVFEQTVEKGGCICALEDWDTQPMPYQFRKRNALIAALSKALVVCEAGMPSGTFSTAEAAANMGRKIYAAPGSIFSPYAKGTNWLIENGACAIIDETSFELALSRDYGVVNMCTTFDVGAHGEVLDALISHPTRPDDLSSQLDIKYTELMQIISDYEVEGFVKRLPDGRYTPTEKALLGSE